MGSPDKQRGKKIEEAPETNREDESPRLSPQTQAESADKLAAREELFQKYRLNFKGGGSDSEDDLPISTNNLTPA